MGWLDFGDLYLISRSHWHFETHIFIEKSLCAHYLFIQYNTGTLKLNFFIEKNFYAHYLLNQWLEFEENWFSLCYLGELQILKINVIHFEQ